MSKNFPDEVPQSDLYNDTNTFTVPLELVWLKVLFKTKNNRKSTWYSLTGLINGQVTGV